MTRPRTLRHGTTTAYGYGCRCELCGEAKKVATRKYRDTHRDALAANKRVYRAEHMDEIQSCARQYRQAHGERLREQARVYAVTHAQEARSRARAWVVAHPDHTREYQAKWREDNRESIRAAQRKWGLAHRENRVVREARRRSRKRGAAGHHTVAQLRDRVAFYGGRCYLCHRPYEEIDHVRPLAHGGSNWPANLRPICGSCNARKGAKSLSAYAEYKRTRWGG